jgi:hypothetical protein
VSDNPNEHLKLGAGDWAHTLTKAGLSAIPFIGGPAAELFATLVMPPLTKRREKWLQSIAEGLKELEARIDGFTSESLIGNEIFVTAVTHASLTAIRNHQKEKLEALRNAVLNVASGRTPDDDLLSIFLTLIDILTPSHLQVLRSFGRSMTYVSRSDDPDHPNWGAVVKSLEAKLPELCERPAGFVLHILKDLEFRGLVTTEWKRKPGTTSSELKITVTDMGRRFIDFLTSPITS